MTRLVFFILSAMLAGGASAAELPDNFKAKSVCGYIAGIKALGPVSYSDPGLPTSTGLVATGSLVRQGVLDLDGDGVSEPVTPNYETGTMGGDAFSVWKADGSEIFVAGRDIEDGGFGGGLLSFDRRWYLVTFAAEQGAFVAGAFSFAKDSFELAPACRFENTVVETMYGGTDASEADQNWCDGPGLADAKAGRLKPVAALDAATEDRLSVALYESLGEDAGPDTYSGTEIYAPASGPFAGLKLWKVNATSGAGRGCAGSFFRIVEGEGSAIVLSASPLQGLLNRMQSREDRIGAFNCLADVALFEANGRFFLDRHSGDEKPVTDLQLNHAFIEAVDGEPKEICRASFEITPRVVWESPDLSK